MLGADERPQRLLRGHRRPPLTDTSSLLQAAQRLGPRIRAASASIESERRLPDDIFRALAEVGVFKAYLPSRFGGHGATHAELAPVIEEAELQEADARITAGRAADVDSFLLAAHHVTRVALDVVDTLHGAAATSGIFASSHLLRCFLDVHVAAAHVSLQPINLEAAGKRLMS